MPSWFAYCYFMSLVLPVKEYKVRIHNYLNAELKLQNIVCRPKVRLHFTNYDI